MSREIRIGAHISVAGGVEKAPGRLDSINGTVGQIFAGSPRTWSVASYTDEEARQFRENRENLSQRPYAVHSTYLVNLASPKEDLREKSRNCLQKELDQASKLGIEYVVFHPGSHTGAGLEKGVENVVGEVKALDIPEDVTLLFENTAGKGTTVGKDMETLAELNSRTSGTGVCIDTCHLYAAGYRMSDMRETLEELEQVGLDSVELVHLNDSKHGLGTEKDEHQHIGEGKIGVDGFKGFFESPLGGKPMVLETPEEDGKGFEWNVRRAREIAQSTEL